MLRALMCAAGLFTVFAISNANATTPSSDSVSVRKYHAACESHGFSRSTCDAMVSAFLAGNAYAGDEKLPPEPTDPAIHSCIQRMKGEHPSIDAPWTAAPMAQMLIDVCTQSAKDDAIGLPPFDTESYCRKMGDMAGGSNSLELSCRQQEESSKVWIESHTTTPRTMGYCSKMGDSAGGSYSLMKSCIEQEEEAASQL